MHETMKLLGSNKSKITKDKVPKEKKVPSLGITEVVLVHCIIVNNNYQQDSRVLYTFIPNNLFGQLLDISPKNFIFLKRFSSEFLYIELWFTDQNSKSLEIDATEALKTNSKRVIQKTSEATGDLIGNKIADRITKVPKILLQNN